METEAPAGRGTAKRARRTEDVSDDEDKAKDEKVAIKEMLKQMQEEAEKIDQRRAKEEEEMALKLAKKDEEIARQREMMEQKREESDEESEEEIVETSSDETDEDMETEAPAGRGTAKRARRTEDVSDDGDKAKDEKVAIKEMLKQMQEEMALKLSTEGWVVCSVCHGWAHNFCAYVEEEDEGAHICELCQLD
uniref:Glutamic acid-rich protein-like n=1 Tax=Diabrotica virgifera virgifera TaxID=50390 RepID=A0A6P7FVB1_DIAVI